MPASTADPRNVPGSPVGFKHELERMPTGIPGLDHVLEGGLIRGHSLLIEGPPGSGKSNLAMRILYEGVLRYQEPALLITFEEFPRQLYLDAIQFGMDLEPLEQSGMLRLVWTPPARVLQGFTGKIDLIDKIVDEMNVRRLVIDSITHFRRVAPSEQNLREVLGQILNALKIRGITAVLLKELDTIEDNKIAFEEYLVDASIRLYNSVPAGGGENVRRLEVRKTRGQGHVSGRHPFELGSEGVAVYPRLRPRDITRALAGQSRPARQRVSTGIASIDRMLHGGLWRGSLNLGVGQPGTGKSVFAYHFLDAGLRSGESALLLSLKNTPQQILGQAETLGMDWGEQCHNGRLRILHYHPSGLCVDKMIDALLQDIRILQPSRLVLDSIDDLWTAVKDPDQVRDYMLVLATLFDAAGTTSLVLSEMRSLGASAGSDATDFSYLASAVLHLTRSTAGDTVQRHISISKHAGSDHSRRIHEYHLDERGFHIVDAGAGGSGEPAGGEGRPAPPAAAPAAAAAPVDFPSSFSAR
jgi:circadian clock protein KaiC